jgi:anti-sigma regulatory factor (Ser/Thr protein kinase)
LLFTGIPGKTTNYQMRIFIPNSAFLGNINHFLAGFDPSEPRRLEITANPKWISVHPVVLCMIAAMGHPVKPENIACTIEAASGHYLKRMGLFEFLGIDSGMKIEEHEPAGRFIPLTQIKTSDDLTHFLRDMVPLLHLDPEYVKPIQYTISELVRNVLEHAYTPEGAIVASQYFKKSNTIRIGIVDRGIGIHESIRGAHPVGNDLDAIKLALTPGITGTTRKPGGSEQNAGAGLFFIKTIAFFNRDPFVVYTGNAMYKLKKRLQTGDVVSLRADPFADRHSKETNLPHWKGVVVGIDIGLNNAHRFGEVISAVQEFYFQSVKERKRARYKRLKKPKFIE